MHIPYTIIRQQLAHGYQHVSDDVHLEQVRIITLTISNINNKVERDDLALQK